MNTEELGRRFARVATNVAVRNPRLWKPLRPLMRLQFDRLAGRWDSMRSEGAFAPYEAALERVEPPRRALDLGTGTGEGALAIARRFREADVVGVDLAEEMLSRAREKVPPELAGRIRFETADASKLPYDGASFDLVAHGNMIPFFDEIARVTAPGGYALFAFSGGAETPIYVPPQRLRSELSRRGFSDFAEISAGPGTAMVARKRAKA
jgi:ubiquinone/menaquinone biosynthesis C-methylase UbiE